MGILKGGFRGGTVGGLDVMDIILIRRGAMSISSVGVRVGGEPIIYSNQYNPPPLPSLKNRYQSPNPPPSLKRMSRVKRIDDRHFKNSSLSFPLSSPGVPIHIDSKEGRKTEKGDEESAPSESP